MRRKESDVEMKAKIIGLLVAMLFALSAITVVVVPTVKAHTESEPFKKDLIAGKSIDVGDVLVWNDEDYLYVKYETTDDWYISEVHLEVATDLSSIPQAKGNPIPGKFTYKAEGLWTQEYVFTIPLSWDAGTTLCIAAHAKVWDASSVAHACIVSDTQTMVKERRSGNEASFTFVNAPAVYAWEPGPNYPNDGPDDSSWQANSLWDQRIGTYHSFFDSVGADWIWESYRVKDPVYGTVLKFERSFAINGIPLSGKLAITCDNGYEAYLNSRFVGSDNVADGWLYSNLKQMYVDTSNWDSVEEYDVSSLLTSGTNNLTIYAANEYFNTDDYGNPWKGTESNNPGGLIFALCVDYCDRSETAWGEGDPFSGKNWATYFTYEVQGWKLVDTVTVNSANPGGTNSHITLETDKQYKFVVTGGYWRNTGGTPYQLCDAEYTTYENENWNPYHDGCLGYTSGWLAGWTSLGANFGDLQVNGQFVDWGPFNANHEYTLVFGAGTGSKVNFRIFDGYGETGVQVLSWYSDNSGCLTVKIYMYVG
jgi:hypothetical protein